MTNGAHPSAIGKKLPDRPEFLAQNGPKALSFVVLVYLGGSTAVGVGFGNQFFGATVTLSLALGGSHFTKLSAQDHRYLGGRKSVTQPA